MRGGSCFDSSCLDAGDAAVVDAPADASTGAFTAAMGAGAVAGSDCATGTGFGSTEAVVLAGSGSGTGAGFEIVAGVSAIADADCGIAAMPAEPAAATAAYAFCISWSSEIADSLPSKATETAVHRDPLLAATTDSAVAAMVT